MGFQCTKRERGEDVYVHRERERERERLGCNGLLCFLQVGACIRNVLRSKLDIVK